MVIDSMTCQARYKKDGKSCTSKKSTRYRKPEGGYICLCGLHDRDYREQKLCSSFQSPKIITQYNVDGTADIYALIARLYENQLRASKNIVQKFMTGIRMVLLVAQMQLGKTGTIQGVISEAKQQIDEDIVPFIIIPVHDKEVLLQAKKDFTNGGLVPYDNIFGTTEIGRIRYLKDAMERVGGTPKLIVIDESHMRSGRDESMDKFLRAAGIYMNGDQICDKVYILTVSATPNAETALLTYREIRAMKHMVVLEPSPSYYGVPDMIRLNRLRSAWSLTAEDGVNDLVDVIGQFMEQKKYVMIRCHTTEVIKQVREALMDQYNSQVKIIDYSQNNKTKDINTIISVKPNKPTVILLAERLRASKRLDTQHIAMCFGWCGDISSTMQGLLGRGCGHNKEQHGVIFYTNMEHARVYNTWCQNLYNPFGTPSDKKYVSNGVTSQTVPWSKNVPIELTLDDKAREMIQALGDDQKHYSYGHMTAHFRALWHEQQPRLATHYPNPIKSSGMMAINSRETQQSSYDKFWVVAARAVAQHNKVINFETSAIHQSKDSGWFMYINREEMRCIVCYTRREKHRAEPIVSDKCAYKPTNGTLTRVIQASIRK